MDLTYYSFAFFVSRFVRFFMNIVHSCFSLFISLLIFDCFVRLLLVFLLV